MATPTFHDHVQETSDPQLGRGLYVVATPLGNLRDITLRALDVLAAVDVVAAEDTRTSSFLLAAHGIRARLIAAHAHNEDAAAREIIALLAAGKRVALISDAGTPGVSDPGARIVSAVRAAGHAVAPVPGANAAVAALSASGFAGGFRFAGFLPARSAARRAALRALAGERATLVFYEAPHRIAELGRDLALEFESDRRVVFARELTKRFETIHATSVGEAEAWLAADADRRRGEFVVLVEGAGEPAGEIDAESDRVLGVLLADLPVKVAARLAAAITGLSKNALYERALKLKAHVDP